MSKTNKIFFRYNLTEIITVFSSLVKLFCTCKKVGIVLVFKIVCFISIKGNVRVNFGHPQYKNGNVGFTI